MLVDPSSRPRSRGILPPAPRVGISARSRPARRCPTNVALQVLPDHVLPLQVLPDQVLPLHVLPDQVLPLHVWPHQVRPDQVCPLQVCAHVCPTRCARPVLPDHVLPFQSPPARRLRASATAIAASRTRVRRCRAHRSSDAAVGQVLGAAGQLERAGPRRPIDRVPLLRELQVVGARASPPCRPRPVLAARGVAAQRPSVAQEELLQIVGVIVRTLLDHQRGLTRGEGGRLARAASAEQRVADVARSIRRPDRCTTRDPQAHDVRSGGDDVDVAPVAPCRGEGATVSSPVDIGALESVAPTAKILGSYAGSVSVPVLNGSPRCRWRRRRRCPPSRPARPRTPAGRPVGLRGVGTVGEVEHPDVQTVVVAMLHDPVDRRDHLRHIDAAVDAPTLTLTMRESGATPRKFVWSPA